MTAVSTGRLITGPFVRVWLGTFGAFASFGFILLVLPLYVSDELDRGSLGVGIAVGAASITAVLAGPPVGRLADRRGRRVMIVVGAVMMVAGYLALALEPSLPFVVLIRLFAGAGEAAFAIAVLTVAADLAPEERRGEAISLVTTASYLGLTIGPVAADFILGDGRFGAAWLVAALLVVLAGAAVIPLGETRPAAAAARGVRRLAAAANGPPPRPARHARAARLRRFRRVRRPLRAGARRRAARSRLRALRRGRRPRPNLRPQASRPAGGATDARALLRQPRRRAGDDRRLADETGLLVGTAIFAVGQALSYPAAVLLAMETSSEAERSAVVGGVTAFVDVALGVGAFTLGAVAAVTGYAGAFLVSSIVALSGLLVVVPLRRSKRIALEEGVP